MYVRDFYKVKLIYFNQMAEVIKNITEINTSDDDWYLFGNEIDGEVYYASKKMVSRMIVKKQRKYDSKYDNSETLAGKYNEIVKDVVKPTYI